MSPRITRTSNSDHRPWIWLSSGTTGQWIKGISYMEPVNDVIGDFASPCKAYTLTFDDDGKVAYAYLKKGKTILGDVWVYNRCPTPVEPEWKDRNKLPFANCQAYTADGGHLKKPVTLDDISVEWENVDDQPKAYVYLFGDLVASVGIGERPGHARFALRDGPLAKRLVIEKSKN
jgi:hypothetical protein